MTDPGTTSALPMKAIPGEEQADLDDPVMARLPTMAQRQGGPPGGRPDRFQYDLAVTVGDRRYQVTVHEPDIPDNLKPLIDRLNDLARRR
jgi:hypothetical protein